MFQGHEQDVIKVLLSALTILGGLTWLLIRIVSKGEKKRMDERFDKLATEAEKRATELAQETERQAKSLADESQRREDELGAFRDRMWEEMRGLRDALGVMQRQNDVGHATIDGGIKTLSTSVDLRFKAVETSVAAVSATVATSFSAVERKMPNGQLERLARATETIADKLGIKVDVGPSGKDHA